jgi:hypothetical protein
MTQTAAALAKKPAALKPALKPAALKPAKSAPTPVVPAAAVGRKKSAGRTLVKPAKVASGKKLAAQGTGQLIGFDVAKQRKARAAATVARLKFDGQTTRRGGHMQARGQRSQARRDSRTR